MSNSIPELLKQGEGPTAIQLEVMPRADGAERFNPLALTVADAKTAALALTVTGDDSPEEQKRKSAEARRLRLDIFKATRLVAAKLHTELKTGILEIGRKLDGAERALRVECEGIEAHLLEQEQFAERERQRIEDQTRAKRAAELVPFLTGPCAVDLGKIDEAAYQKILADSKDLHELRVRREQEAMAERQRIEEVRAAEQERQRAAHAERTAEVARLKQEAAEKEAARLAELEKLKAEQAAREEAARKERKAAEERAAAELKALEEKTRIEREKREAEAETERMRVAEEARKEREAAEVERRKLAAEKEAAEKQLREAQKAEDARKKAEADAARRAAAAPDVEKLRAYRTALIALGYPKLANASLATQLAEQGAALLLWLDTMAAELERGGRP